MVLIPTNVDEMFEVSLGGSLYGGWTTASVTRSMSSMTGTFNVTLHDPMMLLFGSPVYAAFAAEANPGCPVEIYVGGEKFMTGVIDNRTASKSATAHDVKISGRGKTRDIIDSSHVDTKTQYNKQSADKIVEKVASPFGVKVKLRTSRKPAEIPVYRYGIGDNAFDVAHECARHVGCMLMEDKDGNLVMRDMDDGNAAGSLVQGQNLLTYNVTTSDKNRHSEYKGKGQSTPKGRVRGKTANQPAAVTKDTAVKGYRPLVVMAEADVDKNRVKQRTTYEAARRAGQSLQVKVTLYGYKGSNGKLWEPDTLAMTVIPDEQVAEPLLIESVTFTKSQAGSITSLSLKRKESMGGKASKGKGKKQTGRPASQTTINDVTAAPATISTTNTN